MDFRSFYLNYECSVWMYKTNIEKKIKQDILDTITISKEIKLEK